jgi:hyaluronoglucosaminidase
MRPFSRIFAVSLGVAAMLLLTACGDKNSPDPDFNGEAVYEIYPIPQNIRYGERDLEIAGPVNVVFGEGVDGAVKDRVFEAMGGIAFSEGSGAVKGRTNLLVGIHGSGDAADTAIKAEDSGIFDKHDAYILSVRGETIAILGKDADAAFYGAASLKHILSQTEGARVRELLIEDWSDAQWRGFIEGFYGTPWSHEDRISLMEFGGEFKMNAYIFAPKDDDYHSMKWREPYPEDELAKVKALVDVGIRTKNQLVWAIHPFFFDPMRVGTETEYQDELALIIAKFEQLYAIGVRQFALSTDDAGGDLSTHVRLARDLYQWNLSKGDCRNLIFVPQIYNESMVEGVTEEFYLSTIGKLPEDIEIMWTGSIVAGWVTNSTFDFFTEKTGGRTALMWLNWPVNDYCVARLMMGRGTMLDPSVSNLTGIISNPMNQAEASKPSLFAVADYTWNRAGFDKDKSWEASFKHVDAGAGGALHELARHLSSGFLWEESEDLKADLESFGNLVNSGGTLAGVADKMIAELQKITDAANIFEANHTNRKLGVEIAPWRLSLRDMGEAGIQFIHTLLALEKGGVDDAWGTYLEGLNLNDRSKKYETVTATGPRRVEAGAFRLRPFINNLENAISLVLDPDREAGGRKAAFSNNDGIHSGAVENVIDGSLDTFVWFGQLTARGDYIAIDFGRTTAINSIQLWAGTGSNADTFYYGKFQFSSDGHQWTDVNDELYGPYMLEINVDGLDIEARFLRFIQTGDIMPEDPAWPHGRWFAFREFAINDTPNIPEEPEAGGGAVDTGSHRIFFSDNYIKRNWNTGVESELVSIDGTRPIAFSEILPDGGITLETPEGAYLGVDLGEVRLLREILIDCDTSMPVDWFRRSVLEHSQDGVYYTVLRTYESTPVHIIEDVRDEFIYARYVRIRNIDRFPNWTRFTRFYAGYVPMDAKIYTNADEFRDAGVSSATGFAALTGLEGVLRPGGYVGIQLPRIRDLSEVVAETTGGPDLVLQTSINQIEWFAREDGEKDAAYIRLYNAGASEQPFHIRELTVRSDGLSDPAFISVPEAAKGYPPQNILDRSLVNAYKPADGAEAGSLTYRLSGDTQISSLILFARVSGSDAALEARIWRNGSSEWVILGSLTKARTEVAFPEDCEHVLEIRITWQGVPPLIYRLMLS